MQFKEIKGLRPLTEFEGLVTKIYLILKNIKYKIHCKLLTILVILQHDVRGDSRVAG